MGWGGGIRLIQLGLELEASRDRERGAGSVMGTRLRAPAGTCVRAIGAQPLNQRCDLRWWWGGEKKKEKRKNGTSAILFQRFCPTALSSWPAIGLVVTVETNEKPTRTRSPGVTAVNCHQGNYTQTTWAMGTAKPRGAEIWTGWRVDRGRGERNKNPVSHSLPVIF